MAKREYHFGRMDATMDWFNFKNKNNYKISTTKAIKCRLNYIIGCM